MNEHTRNEIVRLWHAKTSQRQIAKILGIARNTVKSVLQANDLQRSEENTPPELVAKQRRKSVLDEFEQRMKDLLSRYPEITAVRMHEELQTIGFKGSYTIVKERVRVLRPRPSKPVAIRFETDPGRQGQMDYSPYDIDFTETGRQRVHAFSYVLGYSRRQYLRFVESYDFPTTVRQHVRAFDYLGGVAEECLYDNMKVVVSRIEDGQPIYNVRFLAFATHYGFRPWACKVRRGQTKGKVERPFWYVETNLLNGRTFRNLDDLNEVTDWWLTNKADVRIHRETKRRPIDMHQEEQSFLLPLPEHPYDTSEIVYRTVDGEWKVAFGANRYSVPWQRIGDLVVVRATESEVIIYGSEVREIARHQRVPRQVTGQIISRPEHGPDREGRRRHELLAERFAELGETPLRFFEGLVQARYGKSEAQKVLALLTTYSKSDFCVALDRAVKYRAFTFSAVERILMVDANPRPVMDALTDASSRHIEQLMSEPAVLPRSPADYKDLIDCHDERGDGDQS